ncbi:sphingosine N-acyltransferase lag1, partial [Entomortierella beljakovae]
HHLITISLITFSLGLNVTTFGTAVLVSMDLADIALSFGKCLKYIEVSDKICDPVFACFMVIWIYTRHFLYGYIIYAWMITGRAYSSMITYTVVNTLLLSLQGLMFFWLYSIFRIVYKMFITNTSVVDDRSDNEEEAPLTQQDNKQRSA